MHKKYIKHIAWYLRLMTFMTHLKTNTIHVRRPTSPSLTLTQMNVMPDVNA